MPSVGFIGLGMMGKPISKKILRAGYPLTVFDINPASVQELVRLGAASAQSPKEVAKASEIVLTSLPSLKACEEVYLGQEGLLEGGRQGQLLVETSTVPPGLLRKVAAAASNKGIALIDAPVIARRAGVPLPADQIAERMNIPVLVGGESNDVERARPVLATFGEPVLHMGPLGAGETAKLAINGIAHSAFILACEAFAVAAKGGVNLKSLYEMSRLSVANSEVLDFVREYLDTGTAKVARTEVAHKDSESLLALAGELGVPVVAHSVSHGYYEWAMHAGLKDRPWAEMLGFWDKAVGKPIRFE